MCLFAFHSQRHGYCTLGEALNRLDFSSAIQDLRRFNYVAKVSDNGHSKIDILLFCLLISLFMSLSNSFSS